MPINYARALVGHERSARANRHLGVVLAFVAGAVNAGGFLAVQQYTSHMTGIVSAMADNLVLGSFGLLLPGLGALLAFVSGSASSAILVNFSRRRAMRSAYAIPLLVEAALLIAFGILGSRLAAIGAFYVPLTVALLCYIMGLQNALITKISKAEIRTTHITGVVTDIGIELGKLFYWNAPRAGDQPKVMADRDRLAILLALAVSFFAGGVSGAAGFKYFGYASTLPLAAVLVALAIVPVMDDARLMAAGSSRHQP